MGDDAVSGWKIPSPVQAIRHKYLNEKGVKLLVKRDDLIHPNISGNKWRKLRYLIYDLLSSKSGTAITFGGAYSNHIYSFAAVCKMFGIKGVVIVRGEQHQKLNPTLRFVSSCGVKIHYVDREVYRLKEHSTKAKKIIRQYADPVIIPEGGSTNHAYKGMGDLSNELLPFLEDIDIIAISAGTGCTSGCLIHALTGKNVKVEVYSALKGDFMMEAVRSWARTEAGYEVITNAHSGGYAKVNPDLVSFINQFYMETGIPLDPIYNGKLVYHLFNRIKADHYPKESTLLWIHTGGLQGIAGFNERWQGKYYIIP